MWKGIKRPPDLAARLLDLSHLGLPGASHAFNSGRELVYRMELSPSPASRLYQCELHVPAGLVFPKMIVKNPDLQALACGKRLPHVYPYPGKGVRLCLWQPKYKEWDWSMKLSETYVPWTVEWLFYFEHWLDTGFWSGGGEHPTPRRRQYRTPLNKKARKCRRIRLSTPSESITSTSSKK